MILEVCLLFVLLETVLKELKQDFIRVVEVFEVEGCEFLKIPIPSRHNVIDFSSTSNASCSHKRVGVFLQLIDLGSEVSKELRVLLDTSNSLSRDFGKRVSFANEFEVLSVAFKDHSLSNN